MVKQWFNDDKRTYPQSRFAWKKCNYLKIFQMQLYIVIASLFLIINHVRWLWTFRCGLAMNWIRCEINEINCCTYSGKFLHSASVFDRSLTSAFYNVVIRTEDQEPNELKKWLPSCDRRSSSLTLAVHTKSDRVYQMNIYGFTRFKIQNMSLWNNGIKNIRREV